MRRPSGLFPFYCSFRLNDIKSKNRVAMKKPTCLNCNSPNIIPIVYGFPDLKLKEQIDNSEVASGGCEVWDDPPEWRCKDCDEEFKV